MAEKLKICKYYPARHTETGRISRRPYAREVRRIMSVGAWVPIRYNCCDSFGGSPVSL